VIKYKIRKGNIGIDMKNIIINKFNEFIKENGLSINLSFDMPKGYEDAFGTFDVIDSTLYLNIDKKCSNVRKLYTLYHELRHSLQYIYSERFDDVIRKSINYVVLYDGSVLKLLGNKWHKSKLTNCDFEFMDVYLNLSYELDANKYAFETVKNLISTDEELEELEYIFKNSQPSLRISKEEMNKIFRQIDKLIGE